MSEWARRVAALPRPLLLALDVDGTLAPIVERPSAARVPDATLRRLASLRDHPEVIVALVTGRDAESLATIAPLAGVWRAVEHGRVVIPPHASRPPELRLDSGQVRALEAFEELVRDEWVPEGAHVEEKPASRAVHVRAVAQADAGLAEEIIESAAEAARELDLHPRVGRAVLEAEAKPGDKGEALAHILEETAAASAFYAGDDVTDTPAIERAAAHGVGLFVRSPERPEGPPAASGQLDGTEGVRAFLDALADALDA